MRKLFVILIGKEQQFDLEIKKAEWNNNLLSNSMSFRKYTNVRVTPSSPVYRLQQVASIGAWEAYRTGQAYTTFLQMFSEPPVICGSQKSQMVFICLPLNAGKS